MMVSALTLSPDSLWLFMQKAWWFLVVLGILVAFHELGHFLAARWVGVKVLKFSLGFGPKLFGRQVGDTEYLLSAIPLGGYVKLFGEDEAGAVTPDDRRRSFVHQGLWGKVFIVSAGPGFNFILAYLIFAAWLATGYTLPVPSFKDIAPVIEAVAADSPAAKAGVMVGDQIKKIDGRDIATRIELLDAAAKGHGAPLTLEVLRDGRIQTLTVTPIAAPGVSAPKGRCVRVLLGNRGDSSGRERGRARKTRSGRRIQGRRSGAVDRRKPYPHLDTDDGPRERKSRENAPRRCLTRGPSGLIDSHADSGKPQSMDSQSRLARSASQDLTAR